MFLGRNCFNRHIAPKLREIFLEIFWIWAFQLRCSSKVRPKKSNDCTLSICIPFIFMFGINFDMFFCLWWKTMNLVFLMFKDNLFNDNHSVTLASSWFILSEYDIVSMSYDILIKEHAELNKFESSANKIAWNNVVAELISFI